MDMHTIPYLKSTCFDCKWNLSLTLYLLFQLMQFSQCLTKKNCVFLGLSHQLIEQLF